MKNDDILEVLDDNDVPVEFRKVESFKCQNPACHNSDIWAFNLPHDSTARIVCLNCKIFCTLRPHLTNHFDLKWIEEVISRIKEVKKQEIPSESSLALDAISQLEP